MAQEEKAEEKETAGFGGALMRALHFLRLTDPHDGNISITNIALIVVLTKLAFARTTSIVDLGMLLLSLANYNAKKIINAGSGDSLPTAATPAFPPQPELGVALKG